MAENGYWSNGFLDAAEVAWRTLRDGPSSLLQEAPGGLQIDMEDLADPQNPIFAATAEWLQQQIAAETDILFNAVCAYSLEDYNAKIMEVNNALIAKYGMIPPGWLPSWWGAISSAEYVARRQQLGCPISAPEGFVEQGPIQTGTGPYDQVPAQQPKAKPAGLGGGTLIMIGVGLGVGSWILYRAFAPKKKGRGKKALSWF